MRRRLGPVQLYGAEVAISISYARGWRAIRSDPEGTTKVFTASLAFFLALFIPFVGQLLGSIVLAGWCSFMIRRAVSGQDDALPRMDFDLNYLKQLLEPGFKAFMARLLWTLPMTMIAIFLACVGYGTLLMSLGVGAVGAASDSTAGVFTGSAGMLCAVAAMCAIGPLLFVAQIPMHAALIRVGVTDDLNAGMRFSETFRMAKLLAMEIVVGQFVLSMIGGALVCLGYLMLCLGVFPALIVFQIMTAYWHAELYQRYLEKGGEPLPVGPLDVAASGSSSGAPSAPMR